MVTLRLIGMTCTKTQEAVDEPYLRIEYDDEETGLPREHRLGPHSLDDGETWAIGRHYDFRTFARIRCWESDRSRDDYIGTLMVRLDDVGAGEQRHLFAGKGARYQLTFEVPREAAPRRNLTLELLRLHCDDAQERIDEPYIVVNDRTVWGPVSMRTGETQRIHRDVNFHDRVVIELWEADRSRSDRIGGGVAPLPVVTPQDTQATFHWRKTSRIDARYTLWYRIWDTATRTREARELVGTG